VLPWNLKLKVIGSQNAQHKELPLDREAFLIVVKKSMPMPRSLKKSGKRVGGFNSMKVINSSESLDRLNDDPFVMTTIVGKYIYYLKN